MDSMVAADFFFFSRRQERYKMHKLGVELNWPVAHVPFYGILASIQKTTKKQKNNRNVITVLPFMHRYIRRSWYLRAWNLVATIECEKWQTNFEHEPMTE